MSVIPPFLIGVLVAPLARGVVKPLVRGVVKSSVRVVVEVRRAAAEVTEEIQDITAEALADVSTADAPAQESKPAVAAGTGPGTRTRPGATTR